MPTRAQTQQSIKLLQAASNGQLGEVQDALDNGADPNARDPYSRTPLLYACEHGHTDVAEALLAAGADMHYAEPLYIGTGATALHYAALNGRGHCIDSLLSNGAKTEVFAWGGSTPMMLAASAGHLPCVDKLLAAGAGSCTPRVPHGRKHPEDQADAGYGEGPHTAFGMAALEGHDDIVELMITHTPKPMGGALHDASCIMKPLLIERLLGHGVCPNQLNHFGANPLHMLGCFYTITRIPSGLNDLESIDRVTKSAEALQLDIAHLLLDAGCDVNQPDARGRTPLMLAARANTHIQIRLTNDAHDSSSRFHCTNPSEYISLLVSAGADTHAVDRAGNSALHHVFDRPEYSRTVGGVIPLLEGGSQPNLRNEVGETPLMLAIKGNDLESVTTLINQGADLHVRDKGERTVLHCAAECHCDGSITRLLLENGADSSSVDDRGHSPLDVACRRQTAAEEVLRETGAPETTALLSAFASAVHRNDLRLACEYLEGLAQSGCELDHSDEHFELFGRGSRAIHYAAHCQDPSLLERLLSLGVDPGVTNDMGWTPLTIAAAESCQNNVERLLAAGASSDPLAADFLEQASFISRAGSQAYHDAADAITIELQLKQKQMDLFWCMDLVGWEVSTQAEAQDILDHTTGMIAEQANATARRQKHAALLNTLEPISRTYGFILVGSRNDLVLCPTNNQFAILAAAKYGDGPLSRTGVGPGEISSLEIITKLRSVHEQEPFDLLNVHYGFDILFRSPPQDPHSLARALYDICPDLDQDFNTCFCVVERLNNERHIYLRWD